jgi:hypothetical protein
MPKLSYVRLLFVTAGKVTVGLALTLMATDVRAAPMSVIAVRQAQASALPLHQSSVFCGANGCQAVTHVKHCALPPKHINGSGFAVPARGLTKECRF